MQRFEEELKSEVQCRGYLGSGHFTAKRDAASAERPSSSVPLSVLWAPNPFSHFEVEYTANRGE